MVTNQFISGNGTIEFDEFLVMMAAKVTGEKADVTTWAHKVPIPYIWDKSFSTLVSMLDHHHYIFIITIYVYSLPLQPCYWLLIFI